MNNISIQIGLIRLFQFMVFVLFTFIVMVYAFAIVLLPLDIMVMIIKILSALGMGGIIAAILAIPCVGYLGLMVYKMPALYHLVIDTGLELFNVGRDRVSAFNHIADSVKA